MFSGQRRKKDGNVAGKLVATITGNRMQAPGEPHLYEITCHCLGKVWSVERSYSEFLELYTKLKKHLKSVTMKSESSDSFPKMPPKHIFAASSDIEVFTPAQCSWFRSLCRSWKSGCSSCHWCGHLLLASSTLTCGTGQVLDAAVDALLSAANKDLELEAVRDFMELGNAYLAALHEESEAEPLTSDEVDKYAQRQAELLTAER